MLRYVMKKITYTLMPKTGQLAVFNLTLSIVAPCLWHKENLKTATQLQSFTTQSPKNLV